MAAQDEYQSYEDTVYEDDPLQSTSFDCVQAFCDIADARYPLNKDQEQSSGAWSYHVQAGLEEASLDTVPQPGPDSIEQVLCLAQLTGWLPEPEKAKRLATEALRAVMHCIPESWWASDAADVLLIQTVGPERDDHKFAWLAGFKNDQSNQPPEQLRRQGEYTLVSEPGVELATDLHSAAAFLCWTKANTGTKFSSEIAAQELTDLKHGNTALRRQKDGSEASNFEAKSLLWWPSKTTAGVQQPRKTLRWRLRVPAGDIEVNEKPGKFFFKAKGSNERVSYDAESFDLNHHHATTDSHGG